MTQHEYVFVTISIILGLAITRLLNSVASLIRANKRVNFHWATALWASGIMLFILQLWWVGWELRSVPEWTILDFFVMVIGSIFLYGAAELALPTEDYDISDDAELDFLGHSQSFGRISALSLLGYFAVGPHVNMTLFGNAALPSISFPAVGGILMLLIAWKPGWFKTLSVLAFCYAVLILYLTA